MSLQAFHQFLVEQIEVTKTFIDNPGKFPEMQPAAVESLRDLTASLECLEVWSATYRHELCPHCT